DADFDVLAEEPAGVTAENLASASVRATKHAPLVSHGRWWRPSIAIAYSSAWSRSASVLREVGTIFTLHTSASAAAAAATARPGWSVNSVSPSTRITHVVSTAGS